MPTYDCAIRQNVPILKCAAVHHGDRADLFVLNRSLDQAVDFSFGLDGFADMEVVSWKRLRHNDLLATNSAEAPDTVALQDGGQPTASHQGWTIELPPASWHHLRLERDGSDPQPGKG